MKIYKPFKAQDLEVQFFWDWVDPSEDKTVIDDILGLSHLSPPEGTQYPAHIKGSKWAF